MSSFYETIFVKKDSSLENKLDSLKLNPRANKEDIYMLEAGIAGEKQVAYHLNKSNIGMYVLRDVNFVCDDLKAQVDFIVVTSHHCYFIECKNYSADIIHVDENSNFEISTKYGKKYRKRGIKSPISQVEDQLSVFQKICLNNQEKVKSLLSEIKYKDYFKTMVVFTNPENRLNITKAPNDIKYRILKVDNLIRQIEYDDKHFNGKKYSQEQMNSIASFILENNVPVEIEEIPQMIEFVDDSQNYSKRNSANGNISIGKILLAIFVIILILGGISSLFDTGSNNGIMNKNQKSLTENQKKAISIFKSAYTNSKQSGFDIIHTSVCKEMSGFFGATSFSCDRFPLEVNVISDTKMTIYKNYWCYTLEISEDGNKLVNANGVTKGYVENTDCKGVPVGYLEWDENNEFYKKIGGYNKIKEMATYAYVNNAFVHDYYDYSHIQERGGNPTIYSTYMMNVDMYFSALTSKGYDIKSPSTNKDETNKMCENYYYIMK